MKTKDLLKELKGESFYVLDTTQDGMSNLIIHGSGDIIYERYCYNIHKYNKLVEGGIFLYRQTKRSSKNRKFYFLGGGVIKNIRRVGTNGDVEVDIVNPFRLIHPVYEDDPRLELMTWTSKKKEPGSWAHFWNQYGMNKITKDEFMSIIGDDECVMVVNDEGKVAIEELSIENMIITSPIKKPEDFVGTYTKSGINKQVTNKNSTRTTSARKTDFDALNKKKKTIGTFGEILIYNDEVDKVYNLGLNKQVDHKSVSEGDGLGYDILSYDEYGNELYIEVKTTESNTPDSFYLTPKEISVCQEKMEAYRVYRVYSLNRTSGTYKVEVYTGTELIELFDFVPVSYVARRK